MLLVESLNTYMRTFSSDPAVGIHLEQISLNISIHTCIYIYIYIHIQTDIYVYNVHI